MIEAIDLTVRRRGRTVLDAVSFDVRPGQVTGVLGGTGAGKTTLLRRMVELERGGGETLFDGRRYHTLRHPMREVGLLLDPSAGHPDQTVRGQLRLALATDRRAAWEAEILGPRETESAGRGRGSRSADPGRAHEAARAEENEHGNGGGRLAGWLGLARRGKPADRINAVLDIVGLTGQSRTRLAELTEGMATRLGIAIALLGDPQALVFDCPERGLEPEGVAWLGALLRAFTSQGRAALVTGSDTETLVGLVDRILLLDHGYLVGTRTAQEVLRAPTGAAVVVRSPQIVRFAAILAEAGARGTQGDGACLEVRGLDRARVGDLAYKHGIPVHELSERFTGSDPVELVLAACSGRNKPVVPLQGLPDGVPAAASARSLSRERLTAQSSWYEGANVRLLDRGSGSAAERDAAVGGVESAAETSMAAQLAGSPGIGESAVSDSVASDAGTESGSVVAVAVSGSELAGESQTMTRSSADAEAEPGASLATGPEQTAEVGR